MSKIILQQKILQMGDTESLNQSVSFLVNICLGYERHILEPTFPVQTLRILVADPKTISYHLYSANSITAFACD